MTQFSVKDILKDPAQCAAKRWSDNAEADSYLRKIHPLLNTLTELKPQLKIKKEAKQLCSRDFGRIKSEGGDLDAAKIRMQQLSDDLAQLELRQRQTEEALLALFADSSEQYALPARFKPFSRACSDDITIERIEDNTPGVEQWNNYVDNHPQASLYHDYRWRHVVQHSFGHETIYLGARNRDSLCGVLPLVRLRSRLFGDFAVSMPYFNYGGVLADNPRVAELLLAEAKKWALAQQLQHIEIRATATLNEWPARTDKASMILALPQSTDALDRDIGAKVRAQINRARQTHATTKIGGIELLDDFYRVFAINMRDLGTPVYSKLFFRNILATFPEQSHLVVVYLNGKPVSAGFLLSFRDMMEIPWASTLRSVNELNINMLLYREILGFCIKQGFRFFDFGRSTKNAGTFKFKKQWGAEPLQHYWHYWLPGEGELPALKPDSPKFKLAVAAWQKLPVGLTKIIGPSIVKFLP